MFMYLFVNVETREVIATRKATRNENEGGGGEDPWRKEQIGIDCGGAAVLLYSYFN